jgi:hypothetical protein
MGGASRMYGKDEKCIQNSDQNLKWEDNLEDPEVDGRIILEWILEKRSVRMWTGFIWVKVATSGGLLEYSNEPSGSIKGGEFIE